MSSPLSVSSSTANFGFMMPIWTISARFFSPPEKPTLTGRLSISASMPSSARLLSRELDELAARQLRLAARTALRVEALAQELEVGDAGNFDRILEAEEQPRRGALVRLQREQVLRRRTSRCPRVTS